MYNYRRISEKIQEIILDNPKNPGSLRWLNISQAGKKEIAYLRKQYNFNLNHLRASIASIFSQRPMIFEEDDYVFLILHFPVFRGNRIVAAEIEFFIGHGYLITIHNGNIPSLDDFFSLCRKNPDSLLSYNFESSAILLYELLDKLIQNCYALLDKNSITINRLENLIFSNEPKKATQKILDLRRNVINIRRIMQNHKNILSRLTEMRSSLVPRAELKKCYDRLVDHSKRIWEMLDNQKEMIEVLGMTNQSLLDNQMTSIMKTLTIFSVIVFPLTLLAAIFSMRTEYMPIVSRHYDFWIIIGLMALIGVSMLFVFKRKRWL
ncbi:MAG: magnesium transporter CorA family protein [Patescibacteria group bacterium]